MQKNMQKNMQTKSPEVALATSGLFVTLAWCYKYVTGARHQ